LNGVYGCADLLQLLVGRAERVEGGRLGPYFGVYTGKVASRRGRAQILKGLVEPRLVSLDLAEALCATCADSSGEGLQVCLGLLLQCLDGRLLDAQELCVEQRIVVGGVLIAIVAAASA